VAVLREKFPEKVPFRLTRMLQKAMGIPGIHGLYRVTCEMVMKILRDNKESLFGVLETFAQDPIISWRLTNDKKQPDAPAIDPKRQIQEQMIGSIMEQLSLEINNDPKDTHIDESPRRARESEEKMQQINEKAVNALLRVKQKLRGTDFQENKQLTVEEQVSRLIKEATSAGNICQSWPGWCPFW
jgi:FKBP12-rapamycin complex-associated protein